MPYGRGTLGNAPNEIEKSYEHGDGVHLFDSDAEEEDVSRVPAFEMQRQAAIDYAVNKKIQETAKAQLDATKHVQTTTSPVCWATRQRLSGPRSPLAR